MKRLRNKRKKRRRLFSKSQLKHLKSKSQLTRPKEISASRRGISKTPKRSERRSSICRRRHLKRESS